MNIIHLRRLSACAAVLLLAAAAFASCAPSDSDAPADAPADAPTDTAASSESETLPDLTDDRTPTSVEDYIARETAAFEGHTPAPASDFTYTVTDAGVTVTGYTGTAEVVILPAEIEGKPVLTVARGAFADHTTLVALSIPDTVTDIEAGALAGCRSLVTLRTPLAATPGTIHFGSLFGAETYETNGSHVPAKLATLIVTGGDTVSPYMFYDCNLEAVFLPDTVTDMGEFAFYGNENLAYIPLGETALTSVGEHAFTGCASLLTLDLPATVQSLGFAMLEGCGSLERLTLPFVGTGEVTADTDEDEEDNALSADHLGYIFGAEAYQHSAGYIPASLITVTLHEGCGDIPANAFFECSSIREVVLPEGVTAIGRRAFYGCAKLSRMTIPDSVTAIGDDAFHGCIRLVDLTVGAGLSTLGVQVFMDCMSLKSVVLPAGVTHLPNSAFAGCRSLETVTAPGVVSQGYKVFHHCDKLVGWTAGTDTAEAAEVD